MSVIVTANHEGETFEVELFQNGDIVITGFDENFYRAAMEFGYETPNAIDMIDMWREIPEDLISSSFDIPDEWRSRLALDWAEHVLFIYKERYQYDSRPTQALRAARAYWDDPSEQTDYQLRFMIVEVSKCEHENSYPTVPANQATKVHAIGNAASAIYRAVSSADSISGPVQKESTIQYAAAYARWARSVYEVGHMDLSDPKHTAVEILERAWQVRRFVDCLEIVGKGGKWPPMEITP